ncbi:hypothetical protein F4802DRAFT_550524 [Xylaria palmicola]|nr:hypothetical protein F4802DRAFT_550524 [Xylaria palmicola]
MLGWALKKGFQGATGHRDAPGGEDDQTEFDAPDTPAPVFAARAIKNAIWGQSVGAEGSPAKTKPNETKRVEPAPSATSTTNEIPADNRSPTKLNSILLTPGTGTSRRKRVSFGGDVKAGNNIDASPLAASSARNGRLRKKTTLQQALENARVAKPKAPEPQAEKLAADDTEEEWEWEDDDVCCNHDMTVDLNEPHSESGKYWKAEWSRYREEAKSDIEQLVKYKVNARSYAAKKDMEAGQLSQKLKEEQTKVAEMEAKIADMTAKLAATEKHGANKDNTSMTQDLTRQTSLVAEYRERVKGLEALLKEASSEPHADRSSRRRINTSPRTEQSILEVGRELRKARSDLRQLDKFRDEVKRLKSSLAISRERVAELELRMSAGEASESSRVAKLEKQLRESREESRRKEADIRKLKRDYDSLKRDAKLRTTEAIQVLENKNAKIGGLEKKLRDMEAATNQSKDLDAALVEHNNITRDLKSGIQSLGKRSRYEKARPVDKHARAASIEDITLEMTQRSLLRDTDDPMLNSVKRGKAYNNHALTEWTADIPTFELQAKDYGKREDEAEKHNATSIKKSVDVVLARRAGRGGIEQETLRADHRVMSDVLCDRVNESSRRQPQRHQQPGTYDVFGTHHNPNNAGRRTASARTAHLAGDVTRMRGALDQPVHRSGPLSRITRAASPGSETPAIDLVRDQFSRLGGPSADRSSLGNTSRCTLPADRQAAARARLEQKKERRKAKGQVLDKENERPRLNG